MLKVTSTSLPALVLTLLVLCSQCSSHYDHLLLNLNQIIASLPCSKGLSGSFCHQEPIYAALEDVTSNPLTLAMLVSFPSANQVHVGSLQFPFLFFMQGSCFQALDPCVLGEGSNIGTYPYLICSTGNTLLSALMFQGFDYLLLNREKSCPSPSLISFLELSPSNLGSDSFPVFIHCPVFNV